MRAIIARNKLLEWALNDITLNQTQCKEYQDEEIQKHEDTENKSLNTTEKQLTEICQKQENKFIEIKNPHISSNPKKNLQKWSTNTSLIVGNSMLPGIVERRILKRSKEDFKKVKVECFLGATIDNMCDIKPLLKKIP